MGSPMAARARKAILVVGRRARRYDMAFPRTQAVYVDGAEDAVEVALRRRVVAVLVTAEAADELLACVGALHIAAPEATIVVVDAHFLSIEGALLAAGAAHCAEGLMGVVRQIAAAVRAPMGPRPTGFPTLQ